jgi:hypothetical protein
VSDDMTVKSWSEERRTLRADVTGRKLHRQIELRDLRDIVAEAERLNLDMSTIVHVSHLEKNDFDSDWGSKMFGVGVIRIVGVVASTEDDR